MLEGDDWAERVRGVVDFALGVRCGDDSAGADVFFTDDVELYHLEAGAKCEPISGRAEVVKFLAGRPRSDRLIELLDILEGPGTVLIYVRGRWSAACSFDLNSEGKAYRLRLWQSVGLDFGKTLQG